MGKVNDRLRSFAEPMASVNNRLAPFHRLTSAFAPIHGFIAGIDGSPDFLLDFLKPQMPLGATTMSEETRLALSQLRRKEKTRQYAEQGRVGAPICDT
jgi:hypothetical protein